MGVLEDLRAITQDEALTPEQKERLRRRLRAQEWEKVRVALPITRTVTAPNGRSTTVTVTDITRGTEGNVYVWGTDTAGVVPWPYQVNPPPLLVPDPAGAVAFEDGSRWRLDPAAALRFLLGRAVRLCLQVPEPIPEIESAEYKAKHRP